MVKNAEDALFNTEAQIETNLLEPETFLGGFSETVQHMILRGDSAEMVTAYIQHVTRYLLNTRDGISGFHGANGFFEVFADKFISGHGWKPPDNYVPQDRPWFKAAVAAEGAVSVTDPFVDIMSGDVILTFSRRIFDEEGRPLGILCLDIKLDRVRKLAIDTQLTEGGYGILFDKRLVRIAHPDSELIGKHIREVPSGIASLADELEQGINISERRIKNYVGVDVIVFFRQIKYGWYMGIVTPKDKYYQTTRSLALFLTVSGAVLAIIFSVILLRITAAKNKADKYAQNEIHKESEKTKEMAYWYKSILDATPFPITVTDANMNWTFVNKAVENFLGTKHEEMMGKPCSTWNAHICNTDDCGIACAKRGLKHTFFTHQDESFQVDVEILKNQAGETAGFIEVVQNITQIEKMANEKAEAQAANSAKSAFLAKMSHEIRTPMNAIMGITEMQIQDDTLPLETRNALGRIYSSGDILLKLVNDILDLSKIEAGKLELMPGDYELASLINDVAQLIILQYESKPIEFDLRVNENTPSYLYGDELRIRQVMNNLLSNAFKYTDSGRITLSVFSEPKEGTEVTLVFQVNDTGQGMTPEQVKMVFEDYTRFNLDTNKDTVGTGLGMSILKHLIDMMSGTISIESEPGKGSTFTVRLPQENTDSSVIGKDSAENLRKLRYTSVSQVQKTQIIREPMPYGSVLVVDDVETNLYVAKLMLQPYGLRIDTALSGFETIDKIKAGNVYDIVFMDHMMPKMDGIETTKKIHGLGYTYPVVALTANALIGQADMFLASGFDDFISKPIDVRQLNSVLKKFVRDKQPPEILEAARQKGSSKTVNTVDSKADGTAQQADTFAAKFVDSGLAEIFVRDASRAVAALETIHKMYYNNSGAYEDEDIRLYIISVHAMKSALANIGEPELSIIAARLEQAGRMKDIAIISVETPEFLTRLKTTIEKLTPSEKEGNGTTDEITDDVRIYLHEKLHIISEACGLFDKKAAKDALTELRQKTWPRPLKELLGTIAGYLLSGDFEEAAGAAEGIIRQYDE
jgi:PAS domain S-box-containing protein